MIIFVNTLNSLVTKKLLYKIVEYLRFGKFLIVGSINTILTYLLYLWLLQSMSYRLAYSISFFIGIVIALILNAQFVYRVTITRTKLITYPIIYGLQYLFGLLVVSFAVNILGVSEKYALALSIFLSIPLMFWLTGKVLQNREQPSQ
jgi:putative flippase GtrA